MTSTAAAPLPALQAGAVTAVEFMQSGAELAPHRHSDAQLMLVARGLVTSEVAAGLWVVPPQCALWIPPGIEHTMRGVGDIELYVVYVSPDLIQRLPDECCTLTVTPLVRELVIEASHMPRAYDVEGSDGRLIVTMLDQLALSSVEQFHLPVPQDPRLRRIADQFTTDPSHGTTIAEWGREIGMSERALFRLAAKETGMSFGRWRQQFQMMLALKRLSEGHTVQAVAFDLGYESSSAFITMFRKTFGKSPLKFLADRIKGAAHPREGRVRVVQAIG